MVYICSQDYCGEQNSIVSSIFPLGFRFESGNPYVTRNRRLGEMDVWNLNMRKMWTCT